MTTRRRDTRVSRDQGRIARTSIRTTNFISTMSIRMRVRTQVSAASFRRLWYGTVRVAFKLLRCAVASGQSDRLGLAYSHFC
eukprot:scaffold149792_cov41-Prasinocladus_malaysianus.AAC.1